MTTIVVLPWKVVANTRRFGRNLIEQHKNALILEILAAQISDAAPERGRARRSRARTAIGDRQRHSGQRADPGVAD